MNPEYFWLIEGFEPPYKIYGGTRKQPPTVEEMHQRCPRNSRPVSEPKASPMTEEAFYGEADLTMTTCYL